MGFSFTRVQFFAISLVRSIVQSVDWNGASLHRSDRSKVALTPGKNARTNQKYTRAKNPIIGFERGQLLHCDRNVIIRGTPRCFDRDFLLDLPPS